MLLKQQINLFPTIFSEPEHGCIQGLWLRRAVSHCLWKDWTGRLLSTRWQVDCFPIPADTALKTVQISLNSIDKVKSFVNTISQFDYDFDLVSGRYVIDAKSIMGIFSLDLSKPIDLTVHAEGDADDVMSTLKDYIV